MKKEKKTLNYFYSSRERKKSSIVKCLKRKWENIFSTSRASLWINFPPRGFIREQTRINFSLPMFICIIAVKISSRCVEKNSKLCELLVFQQKSPRWLMRLKRFPSVQRERSFFYWHFSPKKQSDVMWKSWIEKFYWEICVGRKLTK